MYRNKDRDEQISLTCDIVADHSRRIEWWERKTIALELAVAKLQTEAADVRHIVSKCSRDIIEKAADWQFQEVAQTVFALLDHMNLEPWEVATHTELRPKEEGNVREQDA